MASSNFHPNSQGRPPGAIPLELAHARLGDTNIQTLKMMEKHGTVDGLRIAIEEDHRCIRNTCKVCIEANLKLAPKPKRRTRALNPGQVIGSDVQSLAETSYDGKKYLGIWADHSSAFTIGAFLATKDELKKHERAILNRFERMTGRPVEIYRSDQGGEYTSTFQREQWYIMGLHQEFSDTKMAFQNGLPEVIGGKIVRMTRAALVRSAAPEKYWTAAAAHQIWIHNRVPLERHRGKTTPFTVLLKQKPNLSRARVWGCEAWVMIRRKTKDKLKPRAERAVHFGVSQNKKAWKFLLLGSQRIIESRNAYFYETIFPLKHDEPETESQKRAAVVTDMFGSRVGPDVDDDAADGLTAQGGNTRDQDIGDQDQEDNGADSPLQPAEEAVDDSGQHDEGDEQSHEEQDGVRGGGNLRPVEQEAASRRSGRVRSKPDYFAETDFDGMARAIRSQNRGEREGTGPEGNSAQVNESAVDAQPDEQIVEEAEALEQQDSSEDDDELGDEDDVFQDAQEHRHDDARCYCAFAVANDEEFALLTGEVPEIEDDPVTMAQAERSKFKNELSQARDEEHAALLEEDVADVVDRPLDAKVLPSMFVHKVKRGEHGEPVRFKARFVPLGCCDPWKDLKETFAPTLRYATLRVLIALAAMMGAVIHQLDVKTAFLNGILKTDVYCEQPRGYERGDPKKKVWKLKKALYGLVEAPRLWYETLNQTLEAFGFEQIISDPCLYVLRRGSQVVILGVFVDDFLIFGTSEELVKEVKQMLGSRFKTKDLGPARWVLGMRLLQGAKAYVLDQAQYMKTVIGKYSRYLSIQRRKTRVPVSKKFDLRRAKDVDSVVNEPYRELLGSIGHLAIGTRVDIAYAVSMLSRYVSRPQDKDWKAALNVLRYLAWKGPIGLVYTVGNKLNEFDSNLLNGKDGSVVDAAVDSDFANDPDTGKSVGGYIVRVNGTVVSWRSKLMSLYATSTFHAEYMEAYEGTREVVWLRMLLEGLGFILDKPSSVLEDNTSARKAAETVGISDANKHVKVKFHWIRQCVEEQLIQMRCIRSQDNPADCLTKPPSTESLTVMKEWSTLRMIDDETGDVLPDQGG